MGFSGKWRLSANANVKKCTVMVRNDSKVEDVDFNWKWGDDKLRRVDHYTYLGVEFGRTMCDAHI